MIKTIQLNPNHPDWEPIPQSKATRSALQMRMLVWKLQSNFREIYTGLARLEANYKELRSMK